MPAEMKQVVTITQDDPKVKITVEVPNEVAGTRVMALEPSLLKKITMASHGFAQPDLLELNDPERKGQ